MLPLVVVHRCYTTRYGKVQLVYTELIFLLVLSTVDGRATVEVIFPAAFIGRKWCCHCAHCELAIGLQQIFYLEDAFAFFQGRIKLHIAPKCVLHRLIVQSYVVIDTVRQMKVCVFLRLFYHCCFCQFGFPTCYDEICLSSYKFL